VLNLLKKHCKVMKNYLILMLLGTFFSVQIYSQSMLDVSIGTSHQDNFFANIAFRKQVSPKFRIGLEAQYGAVKYRLIEAKPIREGYAATVSIPLTVRLYEKERIRLDFYAKPGARFQGVLDPDKNDIRDSLLTSTAFAFDPALLVTIKLNEKLNLQSGVSFPVFFQFNPSAIFENVYAGMIHLGLNYKVSNKSAVFFKSAFGPAAGGDGDTQKFGKSFQAGIRYNLGSKTAPSFIEPSF
jgi:hypothetical protein